MEMWPSGRRRSPAKGVGEESSRGFESLRLRHYLLFNIIKLIRCIFSHYLSPKKALINLLGYEALFLDPFLLIQTKPNTTKNAARIKEKSNVSSSNSQPKNIVKIGLKKEKLATLDAG